MIFRVRERERRAHFHESRSRKETRSGARIWATNERENIIHSALDLHTLNFENDEEKKMYRFLVFSWVHIEKSPL